MNFIRLAIYNKVSSRWWLLLATGLLLLTLAFGIDTRTTVLLRNTALLAVGVAAGSLPLGTFLALLLLRTDLPGRRLAWMILGVMLFVPLYLQASAWQAGFGLQGWYSSVFRGTVWLDGWFGAIWMHTCAATPWITLLAAVGLAAIEPELEELALLDAPAWKVIARVTLPRAMPALGVAALWVLLTVAGETTITDLCRVRTYAEELYTQIALGQEPGKATLAVLPGVLLSGWLILAGWLLCLGLVRRDGLLAYGRRRIYPLGRLRRPAGLLTAAIFLVLAGVPLANLVYQAGVALTSDHGQVLRSWSLLKCLRLVPAAAIENRAELGWSAGIGSLAATSATLLGFGLGWLARRGGLAVAPALAASAVGLAVPAPALALAIIWLLDTPACPPLVWLYDHSVLAPWVGQTLRSLPLATLLAWHVVQTVPPSLLEAARLDGAGAWTRLTQVVFPAIRRRLAAIWLAALALAVGDLTVSLLVAPPGVTTVSMRVFQFLHAGVDDRLAALCLLSAAVSLALGGSAVMLLWPRREKL
jgi:iron(III) transport system permease protein